jgi:hypothetical protein
VENAEKQAASEGAAMSFYSYLYDIELQCYIIRRFWRPLAALREADPDVGALFQVDRIDESDLAIVERQNHRHGADTFAKKSHAF